MLERRKNEMEIGAHRVRDGWKGGIPNSAQNTGPTERLEDQGKDRKMTSTNSWKLTRRQKTWLKWRKLPGVVHWGLHVVVPCILVFFEGLLSLFFCLAHALSSRCLWSSRPDTASIRSRLLLPPGFLDMREAGYCAGSRACFFFSVSSIGSACDGTWPLRNTTSRVIKIRRSCNYGKLCFGSSCPSFQASAPFSTFLFWVLLGRALKKCYILVRWEWFLSLLTTIRRTSSNTVSLCNGCLCKYVLPLIHCILWRADLFHVRSGVSMETLFGSRRRFLRGRVGLHQRWTFWRTEHYRGLCYVAQITVSASLWLPGCRSIRLRYLGRPRSPKIQRVFGSELRHHRLRCGHDQNATLFIHVNSVPFWASSTPVFNDEILSGYDEFDTLMNRSIYCVDQDERALNSGSANGWYTEGYSRILRGVRKETCYIFSEEQFL